MLLWHKFNAFLSLTHFCFCIKEKIIELVKEQIEIIMFLKVGL